MHMMNTEMASLPSALSDLDRLTTAFSDVAATPKLNVLDRYQTSLHRMHSRLIRDFVIVRQTVPPCPPESPEPLASESPCLGD
jgi:hypothetical protein